MRQGVVGTNYVTAAWTAQCILYLVYPKAVNASKSHPRTIRKETVFSFLRQLYIQIYIQVYIVVLYRQSIGTLYI